MGPEYGPAEYGGDGCRHRMLVYQILLFQSPAYPDGPADPDADRNTEFPFLHLRSLDVQFRGGYHPWSYYPVKGAGLLGMAQDAANSRIYAGIHYNIDCEVGMTVGQNVGNYAVQRAMSDGAE